MKIGNRKRIIASMLKIGETRVWIDPERLSDVKEAITKADLRNLVRDGAIKIKPKTGVSKGRFREHLTQKRKGRRQGKGSRQGKKTSRLSRKTSWVNMVRTQRDLASILKNKKLIQNDVYKDLRRKIKGGFFRSRRHIKLYLEDKGILAHGKK